MTDSEFLTLSVTSDSLAVPLDLAGARQVIMQVTDTYIRISDDPSMNNYFTIFATNVAQGFANSITTVSSDARLWVVAPTGSATLEVWVIR